MKVWDITVKMKPTWRLNTTKDRDSFGKIKSTFYIIESDLDNPKYQR